MHGIKPDCQCTGQIVKPSELHVTADCTTDTPTFQDNNCKVRGVTSVCDLLDKHDGTLGHCDWPEKSPDLGSTEKVWDCLEQQAEF